VDADGGCSGEREGIGADANQSRTSFAGSQLLGNWAKKWGISV
jgi:hypothetical protein